MGPLDSCRLIHLNLTSFIDNPFTEEAKLNEEKLYQIAYEAMRLADDLVDLEIEAVDKIIKLVEKDDDFTEFNLWSRIKQTAIEGRRCGLGIMGMADMFAMKGIKYDSQEALDFIDNVMNIIFKAELESTIDLAVERGTFKAYNQELEYNNKNTNNWYKMVWEYFPDIAKRMTISGRRNLSFSTVAPTGTVAMMARISSGIEPVFMPFYERKRKCMSSDDRVDYVDKVGEKFTVFTVVHPYLKYWAEQYYDNTDNWTIKEWQEAFENSPYYGSTASEISWEKRVEMQSIIQTYITHSISSTINLPKETDEKTVSDIYIKAWKSGNKGQTIYRQGSREGILINIGESKSSITSKDAPKRPTELEADCYKVKVKGESFIVIVGLYNNKPYEVFAFRPKQDVDIQQHKGVIIKKGKMHYCFKSKYIEIDKLQLANENIEERAATLYASMLLRHGIDIKHIVKIAKKVDDNITSFSSAMCRILSKYMNTEEVKDEKCPQCGGRLIRDGGCLRCLDCDYSKCL